MSSLAYKRAALKLLEDREGVDSLLDFVPRHLNSFQPSEDVEPMRPEHLRPVAEAFMQLEHEPVRLCLSAPPRHGKSSSVIAWAVRYLYRYPTKKIAYVTYNQDRAREVSKEARDLALALGLSIRRDGFNVDKWTLAAGGSFRFTSIGGTFVGGGADLIIVDDPVSSREDAESRASQDRIVKWFKGVAFNRLEKGGSIIVTHTRWTPHDLIGTLTGKGWSYVNLPALSDGKPLWPERFDVAALAEIHAESGDYDFASLYMGEPMVEAGKLFRPRLHQPFTVPATAQYVIGVDTATSATTRSDHSVAVVLATWMEQAQQVWAVVDMIRGQWETPELVARLLPLTRKYKCPVYVEAVGLGKGVPQSLRMIDPSLKVIDFHPVGSKMVRALPVGAAWNRGSIYVPNAPWAIEFLREAESFTGDAGGKDDQIDALCIAWHSAQFRKSVRRGSSEHAHA